jgi:hypothetical protein
VGRVPGSSPGRPNRFIIVRTVPPGSFAEPRPTSPNSRAASAALPPARRHLQRQLLLLRHRALPFSLERFEHLAAGWDEGERDLAAVWRRLDVLDMSGALGHHLRRRMRRPPVLPPRTGHPTAPAGKQCR